MTILDDLARTNPLLFLARVAKGDDTGVLELLGASDEEARSLRERFKAMQDEEEKHPAETAAPDPAHLARTELIRLRAQIVRMAHEVEAACDCVSGKGGPRARAAVADLARRMRDLALSPAAIEASRRR